MSWLSWLFETMAPKQVLDKQAWQWAEQTSPNDVTFENIRTAYRCIIPPCPACSCRSASWFTFGDRHAAKNCIGNPNCYNYLGEKAWIEKNLEEDLKEALAESNHGIRAPGTFIGLKNLGATCYANTFLQVWFHNPEFRRGILEYTDNKRGQPSSFGDGSSENCVEPVTVLDHLQLIFALLLFSDRPFIDPSSFIECLKLDTSQQQDAQEFSKLFISLIEDQLPARLCYQGLNLIQHQFVGRYVYATRCNGCGQQSLSGSKFYEIDLNIKGHATLDDCLSEFLQEEILDGENQYSCQHCRKKQDAVRRIRLLDLPSTLNFQLLRFVFDRQTQNKKKLQTYIQFPQTLDMNQYMTNPDGSKRVGNDMTYDLVSVLIHRGPGAHSGHYVALIKDSSTQGTYRLNDEEVEKLGDDKFRVDIDDCSDADGGKTSGKKPKPIKGWVNSRNAYMLVYRKMNSATVVNAPETTLQNLSPHLQALVKQDNLKYEETLKEQLETKKFYFVKDGERQDMIKSFYDILQKGKDVERDDSFEWVDVEWLKSWLAADCMGTVNPVDNSKLICPHNKMHPDMVDSAKCVPKAAADIIFEKFGGSLRLPCLSSVCRQCVEDKCRIIYSTAMLHEEYKLITQLLKTKESQQECDANFWVGKHSLKSMRTLAEKALTPSLPDPKEDMEHDNEPENGGKDLITNDSSNHVTLSESCSSIEAVVGDSGDVAAGMESNDAAIAAALTGDGEEEAEENWSFNEDLLCSEHRKLSIDTSDRRAVPPEIWTMLKKYFPEAPEFHCNAPVCPECKTKDEQIKFFKERDKASALEQRQKLSDLVLEKKRPSWEMPDVIQLNVVSCAFLDEWRKFVKDPSKNEVVSRIDNAFLLCNHGRFMYNVEHNDALDTKYAFVWPHEWDILKDYVIADIEITVTRILDEAGFGQGLSVSPEFCERCCRERQQEEYSSQFNYTNQAIFIRKVTDDTRPAFDLTLSSLKSPMTVAVAATASDGEGLTDDADDANVINENGKRKHSNGGSGEKVARTDAPVRRSTRKGRVPEDIKLEVSSTQTLRDLKMQVVKAFSVMKLDQHLFLDGVELCDESATLEQLKILPGAILYLQADEPSGETTFMDVSPVNSVEEGFKGTTLVGR